MRKRSKYRPRAVLANPVGYVIESLTPIATLDKYFIDLKVKNHLALANLTKGVADRGDIDTLVSAINMTEAFYRLGFGRDYADVVREGLHALRAVGKRGAESGKFILKSAEMNALNLSMELHDAQLEAITIRDMEKAVELIREEYRQRKMTPITEMPK